MRCSDWLKNDSLCLRCSADQNVVLLVDAMDWGFTYKDLIKKIVCNTESNKCIMYRCESYPGTAALKKFIDQELNEHDDKKFNYCQWDTTDRAILTTLQPLTKNTKRFDWCYWCLTRHSYIAKLKLTSSWYRAKSKATTGVRNTASYIPWLHTI